MSQQEETSKAYQERALAKSWETLVATHASYPKFSDSPVGSTLAPRTSDADTLQEEALRNYCEADYASTRASTATPSTINSRRAINSGLR